MNREMIKRAFLNGVAAAALIAGTSGLNPAMAEGAWEGFYAGIDLGTGVGQFEGINNGPVGNISAAFGDDISGPIGGVHAGYNIQRDQLVFGVEADLMFGDLSEYQPGGNLTPGSGSVTGITDSIDLLASIRGRLGFTPQENLLVYATAGVAYADANHRIWGSAGSDFADFGLSGLGYVAGAGVEWRPQSNYSVRLQALYYQFDERVTHDNTPGFGGSQDSGDFGSLDGALSVTLGLNFFF